MAVFIEIRPLFDYMTPIKSSERVSTSPIRWTLPILHHNRKGFMGVYKRVFLPKSSESISLTLS